MLSWHSYTAYPSGYYHVFTLYVSGCYSSFLPRNRFVTFVEKSSILKKSIAQVVGTCRLHNTVSHINPCSGGYESLKKLEAYLLHVEKNSSCEHWNQFYRENWLLRWPSLSNQLFRLCTSPSTRTNICYNTINDNGTLTGE